MAKKRANQTAEGVEPLTVSVSLGATIPTGDFGNVRPSLEIRNIRLDQDVEPQVRQAIEAAAVAWLAIDTEIENRIMDMLSVTVGDSAETVRERLASIEAWKTRATGAIDRISDEVKKHKKRLDGEGDGGETEPDQGS